MRHQHRVNTRANLSKSTYGEVLIGTAAVFRDLVFIYERNESEVDGLINYKKFELMTQLTMRVLRFQSEVRRWQCRRAAYDPALTVSRNFVWVAHAAQNFGAKRVEVVANYVQERVEMAPAEEMLQSMSLRCED